MKSFKVIYVVLFLLSGVSVSHGQMMEGFLPNVFLDSYTDYSAILLNGEMLAKDDSPAGPLLIDPMKEGTLTVAKVDRLGTTKTINEAIGFKIAILNHRTNALRMYSEETFFEINIQKLNDECEMGDRVMFLTIDPKHQLPRHEISLSLGGC